MTVRTEIAVIEEPVRAPFNRGFFVLEIALTQRIVIVKEKAGPLFHNFFPVNDVFYCYPVIILI